MDYNKFFTQIITKPRDPYPKDGYNGEIFINTLSGNYFKKISCKWIFKGNLIGPQGSIGMQGQQGSAGAQGSIGMQGQQGSTGAQGQQGFVGMQGFQGAQGPVGAQGQQGSIGIQGQQGPVGAQGQQGSQGPALILKCWEEECGIHRGQEYSAFAPLSESINTTAVIQPKGNGSFNLSIPDGTSTGGNNRGISAVDLQVRRVLAIDVASGNYSSIIAGQRNRVTGENSVVIGGRDNVISGISSIASGDQNIIDGSLSFTCGTSNRITGDNCVAFGTNNTVSGNAASAVGIRTIASGEASMAIGLAMDNSAIQATQTAAVSTGYVENSGSLLASATASFVRGFVTSASIIASGLASVALGYARALGFIVSSGLGSYAGGYVDNGSIVANSLGSTATGFSQRGGIINASSEGSYASGRASNNGRIIASGLGSEATGYGINGGDIIASSAGSYSKGYVSGNGSIGSTDFGSRASGFIDGTGIIRASGEGSMVNGYVLNNGRIIVDGSGSCLLGEAYTNEIHTTTANGSFAFGRDIKNANRNSLMIGLHGTSKILSPSIPTISGVGSLQIAGGSSFLDSADGLSVIIGTVISSLNPIGAGLTNTWINGGADYGEYFEWGDGNIDDVNRTAYYVSYDDAYPGKIKIAKTGDRIIGITNSIFGNVGVVGDSAELHWQKSNLRDKYGRAIFRYSYSESLIDFLMKKNIKITEELTEFIESIDRTDDSSDLNLLIDKIKNYSLTNKQESQLSQEEKNNLFIDINNIIPKKIGIMNPEYDPTQIYKPRSARKEWTIVSLLGKVIVRDNGQCIAGQYCDHRDGIAVPGNTWMVIERVSEDTIRIFFRC